MIKRMRNFQTRISGYNYLIDPDMKYPFTETELVHFLKQRDNSALNFLYDRYAPALFSIILAEVNNREMAETILCDCFQMIVKNIDSYNSEKCKLFTWLVRITNKQLQSYLTVTKLPERYPALPSKLGRLTSVQ